MNILLITCRTNSPDEGAELADRMPLGLGYLAAAVERFTTHRCYVLDVPHLNLSFDQIGDFIETHQIRVFGVSAMVPNFRFAKSVTRFVKHRFPHVVIVMGGAFPTTLPEIALRECAVDHVVTGPGEMALVGLLRQLDAGGSPDRVINGILPKVVDDLPDPNYEQLDWSSYAYLPPWSDFPIFSSRGCPFQCNYCSKVDGNHYRSRSVGRVMGDIRRIVEDFGFDHFMIQDDLFFVKKQRVMDFCEELAGFGKPLSWSTVSRIDLLDEEMIDALDHVGLRAIGVGIESGSQKMLDLMNKRLSLSRSGENLGLLNKSGIKVMPYVIVGYPGENLDTLAETEKFLIDNHIYSSFTYAFPFPGTKLWNMAEDTGLVSDVLEYLERDDFSVSSFHYNMTDMSDEEFLGRVDEMKNNMLRAYLSQYVDAKSLRGQDRPIYVYGAGYLGKQLYNLMLEDSKMRKFLDDDPVRIGTNHRGIPVEKMSDVALEEDALCIIANTYFGDLMENAVKAKNPKIETLRLG
jgi:radical SAM superfamily enzyme YgiQ (UPF0313 family)